MFNSIQNYFFYTKSERRGTLILVVIILAFLALPHIYSLFITKETVDFSEIEAYAEYLSTHSNLSEYETNTIVENKGNLFEFNPNIIDKEGFIALGLPAKTAQTIINYRNKGGKFYKKEDFKKIYSISDADYNRLAPYIRLGEKKHFKKEKIQKENEVITLFEFNPNTATLEEFTQLGLSVKVAKTIVKYRNKGGQFYKKEDFKKIYSITQSDYERLVDFIKIPSKNVKKVDEPSPKKTFPEKFNKSKKKEQLVIDINQAGEEEFKKLYGIGPSFSKRIVKYRNILGGFTSIEQLQEVYGLSDSTYQKIKPHLVLKTAIPKKINLNTATVEELKAHPYLNYRQAKAIIAYRDQHGDFSAVEGLQELVAISSETYQKIVLYLKVEWGN